MDNPNPFVQMVVPPWMRYERGSDAVHHLNNSVPARVAKAYDFALSMANRSFPVVAVDNIGSLQSEPAPELTAAEEDAWNAACRLLADYFAGEMGLDALEKRLVEAQTVEVDRRRQGTLIQCGECKGDGHVTRRGGDRQRCDYCMGCGKLMVCPAVRSE